MAINEVTDIFHEAIRVVLVVGAPMLLLSMVVGVVAAILQAVTQIHEQTISFVLKLIVVVLFLILGGGWMLQNIQDFALSLFELMV